MLRHHALALFVLTFAACAVAQNSGGPQFEVATIKPNRSGGPGIRSGRPSPTRYESQNTPVMFLIRAAWNRPQFRILGGPDWLQRDRFDIQAAMPAQTTQEEMRLMLQNLLRDRLQLVVTEELREQSVYILQQTRSVKIHPLPPGSCVVYDPNKPQATAPGQPQPKWCGGTSFGPNQLMGTAITIGELAQLLEEVTHRAVIDRTGLLGQYDIALQWTPDERTPGFSATAPPPPTEPGPSLFTVLEEELGLKLDAGRAPVDVLVIQSVQQPSEN